MRKSRKGQWQAYVPWMQVQISVLLLPRCLIQGKLFKLLSLDLSSEEFVSTLHL